jgi:competence protein ComEC
MIFFIFTLCISLISIFDKYSLYKDFCEYKFNKLYNAKIITQYKKNTKNKSYTTLKIKYKNIFFYTSSKYNLENIVNKKINITTITNKLSFKDFLFNNFYLPSYNIQILNSSYEDTINFIQNQHKNNFLEEIFSAMFLSSNISYKNRQLLTILGIPHLIAISGYHIGLLWFLLYIILSFIYKIFQKRFFPYTNKVYDISILIFSFLLFYTYFIGTPISLLRSMVMLFIGFLLFYRHIKILSFSTLFIIILSILSLDISLIYSIALWLSITGVFYIYLFLKYFKTNKILLFLSLNFWLFLIINPIVHFIFPTTSIYQLFSPIISLLFNIFYPVELFLHSISYGNFLDIYLLKLLSNIDINNTSSIYTPTSIFIIYLLLSIGAIFKKNIFILLNILMICINIYFYLPIFL